jgi:hypothetical protein
VSRRRSWKSRDIRELVEDGPSNARVFIVAGPETLAHALRFAWPRYFEVHPFIIWKDAKDCDRRFRELEKQALFQNGKPTRVSTYRFCEIPNRPKLSDIDRHGIRGRITGLAVRFLWPALYEQERFDERVLQALSNLKRVQESDIQRAREIIRKLLMANSWRGTSKQSQLSEDLIT